MQAITTEIAAILLWIVSQHHRNHSAEIPGHLNKVCRRPFGKQSYLVHKSDMESFIIRERKQAKVFLQYCAADGQAHYDQLYHNSNLMEDLHCWPSDWYKWLHMWSLPWQRCTKFCSDYLIWTRANRFPSNLKCDGDLKLPAIWLFFWQCKANNKEIPKVLHYWSFVREVHQSLVDFPTKGQ